MNIRYNKVVCFRLLATIVFVSCFFVRCKKLVDPGTPATGIASSGAYATDATSIAILDGIYVKLNVNYVTAPAGVPAISVWAGLSADELTLYSGGNVTQMSYYKNALGSSGTSTYGSELWQNVYPLIYSCNAAIEGLTASVTLTPAVKQQLLGESKFMRALFYFYLVNSYGDVPLALSTDFTINTNLTRSSKDKVFDQIVADLVDAQSLLNDNYLEGDALTSKSTTERVRPNKSTATALLARVYLFMGKWVDAESQSSQVIGNSTLYALSPLSNAFKRFSLGNKEAIWQVQTITSSSVNNTPDATYFNLNFSPVGVSIFHGVTLSSALLNSFEPGDQRKVNGNWVNVYTASSVNYYYANKYKDITTGTGVVPTEFVMMLRLGEQYLIRAEARAQQSNLTGAAVDLDSIRHRAGLPYPVITTQAALLSAILHERQVELFTELGHRWFDLKRTGAVDSVMNIATPLKGGSSWNTTQQLYPIPITDIQKNQNLIQNPGYQ